MLLINSPRIPIIQIIIVWCSLTKCNLTNKLAKRNYFQFNFRVGFIFILKYFNYQLNLVVKHIRTLFRHFIFKTHKNELFLVLVNTNLVPKDRIELSADPYQGPVLPLNYIGVVSTSRIELLTYNLGGVWLVLPRTPFFYFS